MARIWYNDLLIECSKPTYKQLLSTYEWSIKRHKIIKRDRNQCQKCKHTHFTSGLVVHHKKYIPGILPWEYPEELLITLCDECHQKTHNKLNTHAQFREGISQYIKRGLRF